MRGNDGHETGGSMSGDGGVLRRKLGAVRPDGDRGETGGRAWRVAFARAARGAFGLELDASALRDDRRSLAELLDMMPDQALFAVLEGPQQGLGLLVLSPEMLASVIEVQTIGKVSGAPPLPRRPTRTDAAMTAGLVDASLCGLETALATSVDLRWTAGFRYASFLEDARPLGLLLDDVPYRVLVVDYAIAGGPRNGRVILALPAEGKGPRPAPAPMTTEADEALDWSTAFNASVLGADVLLDAVIGKIRVPLAQAFTLAPGMELVLSDASVTGVSVLVPGGEIVAQGKLGQCRGMRAVRLTSVSAGAAAGPFAADMGRLVRIVPSRAGNGATGAPPFGGGVEGAERGRDGDLPAVAQSA